jgi:hypothetical protein
MKIACVGRLVSLTGLLALAFAVDGPSVVFGAEFAVNATHDAVDAAPGDGVCADASGACTLRAAVMEANALPGGDSILLDAATYTLSISGVGEDAAATGDLDVTDTLGFAGKDISGTVIDGGGVDRVLDIDPGARRNFHTSLTFLTIRNGSTSAVAGTADDRGGGILNHGSASLLFGVIADNEAGMGGGVFNEGEFATAGENAFRNNRALGTTASAGGAIYNAGTLDVSQVIIDGNGASLGGGVFNSGQATVRGISNITANTANTGGGGIHNEGTITIRETAIARNSSPSAGGLANPGSEAGPGASGTATLTNVTVSGNSSAGIANGGVLSLTNVTVAYNSGLGLSAGEGEGISLRNTILARNSAGDCDAAAGSSSLGHNLDSDGSCSLSGPGDLSRTDPNLGPLADNGGRIEIKERTLTHELLAGSGAIDAGDNNECPFSDPALPPTAARRKRRWELGLRHRRVRSGRCCAGAHDSAYSQCNTATQPAAHGCGDELAG